MKKTVYPALDLLKLIMAVLVVAVHANPLYMELMRRSPHES